VKTGASQACTVTVDGAELTDWDLLRWAVAVLVTEPAVIVRWR